MTKLVGILTNVYVLLLCREPFLLLRGRLNSLCSATSGVKGSLHLYNLCDLFTSQEVVEIFEKYISDIIGLKTDVWTNTHCSQLA